MLKNDIFLRACKRQKTEYTPVWFMRQAGRYQKEYRKLREKYSIEELIKTPELAAQVTLLPLRQMEVDAAILFSDIITPFLNLIEISIEEGKGPVLNKPIRNSKAIRSFPNVENIEQFVWFVGETIEILKKELQVPLIGFVGAPFTLAAYFIEGQPSKHYVTTRKIIYSKPDLWQEIMDSITNIVALYGKFQIEKGVDALQIFDSWVGILPKEQYRQKVKPFIEKLLSRIRTEGIPIIYYGLNTSHLLEEISSYNIDVVGIDWRVNIYEAWKRLGQNKSVQGNLDPTILLESPWEVIQQATEHILNEGKLINRHIFNLGHGVLPDTQPETLQKLVDFIHEKTMQQ